MNNARNGERGIRSILYALYQSPCTIPFSCETQVFKESDGSKTCLTLKDGKVSLEHQDTIKSNAQNNDNEEEEKLNNENESDIVSQDQTDDDDSFEYITSANGEASQFDFIAYVTDEKISGDSPKNLNSKLMKIYKHVYKSLLNLYDLPVTKLSLHFGIKSKGEIENENEGENKCSKKNVNSEPPNSQNDDKLKEEGKTKEDDNKLKDDNKSFEQNGKLEDQVNQITNVLIPQEKDQANEKEKTSTNNETDTKEKSNDGQLENQINDNVNGLLGTQNTDKEEDPSDTYEFFLLKDSYCVTCTQTLAPEDDDDLEGKFGEFFSEEIKTKIDYEQCYINLPDCGIPNYKTPRSMCILLKAHKKFPKASCARLYDLIQPRFERFDENEDKNDETDRNSYSTDLNADYNYTTDSSCFNNREYINPTKTIIDYDLYNEKKKDKGPQAKSSQNKPKKTYINDQIDSQKADSENSDNDEPKTTELSDIKVFVCVRCWHMISSINYVSFIQHQELPVFHTLPPRPFQPVVQSELYDKRLYPMGLTASFNKPYSFMLCVENSPYKRRVPQPRKPPAPQPLQTAKRPKTATSLSSSSGKSQDVFQRLLSNTWSTQKNDGNMERQFKVSRGYKKPKTEITKMIFYPESPSALKNAKRSYSRPPFDINMLDPKRKRKLHPTHGESEDFSYRMGGSSDPRKQMSGRRIGDDRPDFVL